MYTTIEKTMKTACSGRRLLQLLPVLLLLSFVARAQTGKITGRIHDETQQPVVAATVLLKKAADSSLVKVALSDTTGSWQLEEIPFNRYFITITYIGYKEWNGPVFTLDQPATTLESASLQSGASNLKGVTVAAKKPFIEQQLDRTVVNVESSIMAAGGSALEVMEKLPGVLVDKNGNISIKGKQGVKVMIDDRPGYLSAAELTAFLRNMPASQLDQIEIMSNPPAKYDAAGNGVINIKRKKLKTGGFNGTLTLTALQGRYPGTTQNLNFNYSNKHVNFYGNAGFSYRKSFEDYYIVRNFRNGAKEITSIYDQHTYTKTTGKSITAKLGADYYASAKTTIGVALGGFHNPSEAVNTNNTLLKTGDGVMTTRVDAPATTKGKWDNMEANVSLKHVFAAERELLLNADYLSYNSTSEQHFDNRYFKPDSSEAAPRKSFLADLPAKINIYSLKADYTHPFSDKTRLEAGVKTSFVNTDNNAQYFDGVSGGWKKNDSLSNHFLYKENVNAGYLNLRHKHDRWEFQAGLRAEQTWLKGEQKNNGQTFSRSYLQFFPSAFVAYDVDKESKVTLSYGRRIERPDYRSMNPFRFYLDQYTYNEGNPYLNPQYSHNIELGYSIWEGALTTTLLYNRTTDIIQEVILQNADKNETYQRPENLNTRKVLGANVNAQIPIGETMTTVLYMDYNHYDYSGAINNEPFELKAGVFTAQLMQQVKLQNGWGFQFMGTWSSRSIDGTFLQQPIGTLHAGIQKDILGKQATIRLSASDIFGWNRYNATSRYQNIDIHIRGQWQSQVLKLAFTYRFNKNDRKETTDKRESAAEEERQRVKTEKK